MGLFITSLNLLPAGQLDGGHVLYAVAGRRTRLLPAVLLATLLWLGLHGWAGWLFWAAIIVFMVSLGHPPSQNDARPLDGPRVLAACATVAVFVLTFVPEPIRILP